MLQPWFQLQYVLKFDHEQKSPASAYLAGAKMGRPDAVLQTSMCRFLRSSSCSHFPFHCQGPKVASHGLWQIWREAITRSKKTPPISSLRVNYVLIIRSQEPVAATIVQRIRRRGSKAYLFLTYTLMISRERFATCTWKNPEDPSISDPGAEIQTTHSLHSWNQSSIFLLIDTPFREIPWIGLCYISDPGSEI